ncbi:uncharacterized protein BX663DRAFT_272280 [Cokeromyces recurvatus]|uniref:uncharacterized protein n=1 Tax=Cokeromyces recurvatus TaxID=90255 RepID=UPI00221EC865|nr:uncharacterized protein BX663DRAFT_272280 [Cokeromyces recurvatus]KAI7897999.1 hypothetical protein BX663DRAFT_272280 [Cokeromyces recurvatus]
MSRRDSNLDLPALSADESIHSSGNMTDTSINDNKNLLQPTSQPLKPYAQHLNSHNQQQQHPSFMDQSFLYNLDQISSNNSLFYMQPQQSQHPPHQQQQQQQQQQHLQVQNSLFGDQFLEKATNDNPESALQNNTNGSMNASTSTLAQSIATNIESFQAAVTTSVGEQPPSFWTGLNNFISNVTHTSLFPTFPNIARSFTEYLANHPVPFLSSFLQRHLYHQICLHLL